MSKDWTSEELTAIVADYFSMLAQELAGKKYNKTQHRRTLLTKIPLRSSGSIEFKHQNISAVLHQLNLPSISGYKPLHNFQGSLVGAVEAWLEANPDLLHIIKSDVQLKVSSRVTADFKTWLDMPPPIQPPKQVTVFNRKVTKISAVNWLAKEAANQSLGLAGEQLVLEYEDQRLRGLGKKKLAEKIEHTSKEIGDGTGFDILSFNQSGEPRHIEVKTTRYGKNTPFWLSANELSFSESNPESYYLYRVYNFRCTPKLFMLDGLITDHCQLKAQQYMATF
ncbi:protein NO VEIN domain-containing protein [Spongorhabdus nitratireducens]